MSNKLITDKEVIQMVSSSSERGGKGDVAPELVSKGNKVILQPPAEWYGVDVVNNQNLSLDVSALTLDSPGPPKVYTFYLVLFTHVGTTVRWSSQFTWVNGAGAPVMEACRGYVYKVEVILDSGSHHKNPLVEFVDNECLVAITPEYDFPIVYPPVSGVIITAKYNNDYQDEEGNIYPRVIEDSDKITLSQQADVQLPWIPELPGPDDPGPGDPDPSGPDGPKPIDPDEPSNPDPKDPDPKEPEPGPTRFPPGEEYYYVMDDPQGRYKRSGFRLFLKLTANYIPSNKSVYLVFMSSVGIVVHVVEMNGETLELEIDTSVGISDGTIQFGYVIDSPNTPPRHTVYSWTKLGNF